MLSIYFFPLSLSLSQIQSFKDEIDVNDYHILKISKLLPVNKFSALHVELDIDYNIANNINAETHPVVEQYIHLLQKWKAESPRTVKQLKEILVQIDLGGLLNKLKNES